MKKMKLVKNYKGGYKFFLTKETKEKLDRSIPVKVVSMDDDGNDWWGDDDTVLI